MIFSHNIVVSARTAAGSWNFFSRPGLLHCSLEQLCRRIHGDYAAHAANSR
ncbi:MAG: hypothetical protein QGI86_24825 [Candidatus Poribacteria bacterium]|nr:hypothetical protein [Candidatus Poribacteria bacterium]MDP6746759.1 hypothetical protein [Candidatus Poribacteria bacterium]